MGVSDRSHDCECLWVTVGMFVRRCHCVCEGVWGGVPKDRISVLMVSGSGYVKMCRTQVCLLRASGRGRRVL